MHGAYFAVGGGELLALDEATGDFEQVAAEAHRHALGVTLRF